MSGQATVFDSSIYIPYLRGQAYANLIEPAGRAARVRLSPVVVCELYAGTRSARDKADLDTVVRAYRSLGFLLQVTAEDARERVHQVHVGDGALEQPGDPGKAVISSPPEAPALAVAADAVGPRAPQGPRRSSIGT